jgi:hypothetical protein
VSTSIDIIVVGAPSENENKGAANVFVRNGTEWNQKAHLSIEDGDYFGQSVGISGDAIVVSNHGEDGDGADSGAVYVFVRSGGSWNQQFRLTAINTEESDYFGYSVSIAADTIVVGAPGEDSNGNPNNNGAESSGAAYVFVISKPISKPVISHLRISSDIQ